MPCHLCSNLAPADMGPRGGGGGDCKGCGVEIADRELGSGVGHGEMQKRAERESCHICTEEPPNQSAEKISLAEPPSTATNQIEAPLSLCCYTQRVRARRPVPGSRHAGAQTHSFAHTHTRTRQPAGLARALKSQIPLGNRQRHWEKWRSAAPRH